jgi:hypothetical protein
MTRPIQWKEGGDGDSNERAIGEVAVDTVRDFIPGGSNHGSEDDQRARLSHVSQESSHDDGENHESREAIGSEGESEETWSRRREFLKTSCRLSGNLMRKGVPRVRVESGSNEGSIVNYPRYVAFGMHRSRLRELFKSAFESTDSPTGLILYSLCGRRACIEPSHLVLAYRRHASEIEERRVQMFCTDYSKDSSGGTKKISHWWSGTDEYYDVYVDIASAESTAEKIRVTSRRVQAAARRKLNRKKSRIVPEAELEKSISNLFGKIFTIRMWKEIKVLMHNGLENVLDKAIIDYSARAMALKSGSIRDHERKYFTSGERTNNYNRKGT